MAGVITAGAMQADDIGGRADIGHGWQLLSADIITIGDWGSVVEHNLHAKPQGTTPRHGFADPPHADNTKGLA